MTTRDQLLSERRGALRAVQAIVALRHPPRTVAVDLAIGMAEHAVRELVKDYTRQLAQPEPQAFDLIPENEGATR